MRKFELIAPCHFGMEAVLKKEIVDLGYDVTEVADGRLTFLGDEEAVCRTNVFLRTAERILIKIGRFHAETYEELFQGTKALAWEEFIPEDGKFWVAKAASVKSKLFSPSDIQSIMKKAMVERLKEKGVDSDRYIMHVSHADAIGDAQYVVGLLQEAFPKMEIQILDLSPAFVTQGGPKCVAIQYCVR